MEWNGGLDCTDCGILKLVKHVHYRKMHECRPTEGRAGY